MLCDKSYCTGCAGCAATCPTNAITMLRNDDGFYYSSVQASACVHCGRCEKTCPVLTAHVPPDRIYPHAWLMKNRDPQMLLKSASGGAFGLLAEKVIHDGGCVYGAVWNEDFHVELCRADNIDQIDAMHGSKYTYSHAQAAYRDVKSQLLAKRKVLFVGLPCQIAALNGFLSQHFDTLCTVEIACHGAGSEAVFDAYIDSLQQEKGIRLKSICQTSKKRPWSKLIQKNVCLSWEDGSEQVFDFKYDSYLSFYMSSLCVNPACAYCKEATLPRKADITMADFMGVGVVKPHRIPLRNGVSAVLANTKKGLALIHELQAEPSAFWEEVQLEECMVFNLPLWKPPAPSHGQKAFFQAFRAMPFSQLADRYYRKNIRFRLLRLVKQTINFILGPHLTACGMYLVNIRKGIRTEMNAAMVPLQTMSAPPMQANAPTPR